MEGPATILTVKWTKQETPQMRLICLRGEKDWSFVPGQVALLTKEGLEEAYFAMASAPEDKGGMEFLVRRGGPAAEALFEAEASSTIQGKGPLGKGFPVERYLGRDLLLACVGTAIAPMRSVLRSISRRRASFGKVVFVYGARHPDEFAFLSEEKQWRESRFGAVLTVSRPEGYSWTGKVGHVQDHFGEVLKSLSRPVALLAGMKDMVTQSRNELVRLGVAPGDVLTNF
ncbi:MAG: NAD-binding oxidoreductase [Chloroflexi bacterium]|nr:NAD-binding oxidoreductase [Chloroflexota bacterium]